MIIRPALAKDGYTSIPNKIINDRRLDADTRAFVIFLLSKPKAWAVRPRAVAKALSRFDSQPLGRTRISRIFKQAMAAGYMARSVKQTHQKDGNWGPFIYFVGMPDDVALSVREGGIEILAHAGFAHTQNARACGTHTQNQHTIERTEKREINEKLENPPLKSPPKSAPLQAGNEELTAFGAAARDQGCVFIYEGSAPFTAWQAFRGEDGMPLIIVERMDGKERRGVWLPTLYPPRPGGHSGDWRSRRDDKHAALAELSDAIDRRKRSDLAEDVSVDDEAAT